MVPVWFAHQGSIGVAGVVAVALFMAAWPLGAGAYRFLSTPTEGLRRAGGVGLGVLAAGCLCAATVLPFIIHPGPSVFRPSTTAHMTILSPRPSETITGNQVRLVVRLTGGRLVAVTSTTLVPNEGHLHVWLDGRLVSMPSAGSSTIAVTPGGHTLDVEFVAMDHGPFSPRVRQSVTFDVREPAGG